MVANDLKAPLKKKRPAKKKPAPPPTPVEVDARSTIDTTPLAAAIAQVNDGLAQILQMQGEILKRLTDHAERLAELAAREPPAPVVKMTPSARPRAFEVKLNRGPDGVDSMRIEAEQPH